MGKEWLYWLSGGYGGAGKSGPRSKKQRAATSAGCMCSVSQLLGLHRFQIPLNSDYSDRIFVHDEEEEEANVTNKFKGVEAPRNSLEEEPMKKGGLDLNLPVGINPIKTSHEKISSPRISNTSTSKSRIDDFSSDSPCTKTPTLVARLMGLDLLPDSTTSSPSYSSSSNSKNSNLAQNHKRKDNKILQKRSFFDDDITIGARSERRRSDVEYYHDHRLSLQVNKENVGEEFGISGKFGGKSAIKGRFDHGSRSPSHYAKQIVKQVKESVGKRMGLSDVTNTTNEYNRRDENLVLLKPTKKIITNKSKDVGEITATQSCSPRLRFLDTNKNKSAVVTNSDSTTTNSPRIVSVQCVDESLSKIVTLQEQPCDHGIKKKKGEERFVGSKATNYNAKLVEKKSKNKNHHWSSEILNISGPMLLLPVKKDPSPPATKLPQKQVQPSDALQSKSSSNSRQLPSNPHHSYKHPHNKKILITTTTTVQKNPATTPRGGDAAEYKNYILKIFKRADINTTQLNPTTRHPLDPSIFHFIELFHPVGGGGGVLNRRCNRKLVFELIDEILGDFVSNSDFLKWGGVRITEFTLVDEVCRKISSFPAKNCEVLEDIDGLIDTDLCTYSRIDEEREGLVCEIEKEIMDMLVRETAATVAVMASVRRRTVGKRLTSGTW